MADPRLIDLARTLRKGRNINTPNLGLRAPLAPSRKSPFGVSNLNAHHGMSPVRCQWFRPFIFRPSQTCSAKSMKPLPENLNSNVSCASHPDGSSSTAAKINRATLHKRTAIVDPNYHRSSIVGVRNSDPSPKGERPVCGGHGTGIELFPRCRSLSGEFFAIVRRNLRLGGAL